MRPGLTRMRRLLDHLDHPEHSFQSVLVTGSNGKGTTCAVLASCLQQLGWTTGLFTSPHLVSVRERFRVDGAEAPYSAMNRFLKEHGQVCRQTGATYFETTTAFALWWFRRRHVQWAVLEIGLGGRLDACNAVEPALSIVTSVSLEHTEWLGDTQEQIAREKGGVARRGTITFAGSLSPSALRGLRQAVSEKGGRLVRAGRELRWGPIRFSSRGSAFTLQVNGSPCRLRMGQAGGKAAINAGLAAAAAQHICTNIASAERPADWKRRILRGVHTARMPARLEQLQTRPFIIADVAHNEASVIALVEDWRRLWPRRRPVILVGLLSDKPVRRIGELLSRLGDTVVITRPDSPRAVDPNKVKELWQDRFKHVHVVVEPVKAVAHALRLARGGSLLVTGSHYVVGPVLPRLRRPGRVETMTYRRP